MSGAELPWAELHPPLRSAASRKAFMAHARQVARSAMNLGAGETMDSLRSKFAERVGSSGYVDRQVLLAAGLVVADLAMQGWQLRVRDGEVAVRPPLRTARDPVEEKARIRRQELLKRDAQLRKPSVRGFLASMERTHEHEGKFVSVFSLMRDGRDLAQALRQARGEHRDGGRSGALSGVIDPYLQFVTSDLARCPLTGLRLMDIWRYFRYTWSNQSTSVPGRSMMFLVRDRAAPFHPIACIGALSSPVIQIRERDMWIGWHPDAFVARVRAHPTPKLARWLLDVVTTSIGETYIDDLIEDGILAPRDLVEPSDAVIRRLAKESHEQRRLHHRFVTRRDHRETPPGIADQDRWQSRARTHLFRSKRALALATYLKARAVLSHAFGSRPTAAKLVALADTGLGSEVIRKIVKKAKSDRVGIAVADISVCGAVQPYNAILGGKLAAMLAASPEVVLEYRRRYGSAESEIASAVAGRPIVREPNLVLLGTTSLYGVGSSQYNRIRIPCDRLGGSPGETIRYEELGKSEAFGTSQYSEEAVKALTDLVQQTANGQRVNSIFGEGVSPKLRKVRQGLDLLGLPSKLLLRHHRRRVVYGVSLVRNLREHLLGLDPKPCYLVPMKDGSGATAQIVAWWRERWLCNRINSDDVLAEVERHSLVRPVLHGARVIVPPDGTT